MTDAVAIANLALSAIGTQSTIASFGENSTEAQHVAINYDATRTDLLRTYRFGFSYRQISLALLRAAKGTPENASGTAFPLPHVPWLYGYAQPADCLMARLIVPQDVAATLSPPIFPITAGLGLVPWPRGPAIPFAIAQSQDNTGAAIAIILTNQQQAILDYSADVTDPNLWDSLFQSAMVGRLAARLVIPLSGDKALAKIAIEDGLKSEQTAAAIDANEGLSTIDAPASWMVARGAGDMLPDSFAASEWPWPRW